MGIKRALASTNDCGARAFDVRGGESLQDASRDAPSLPTLTCSGSQGFHFSLIAICCACQREIGERNGVAASVAIILSRRSLEVFEGEFDRGRRDEAENNEKETSEWSA